MSKFAGLGQAAPAFDVRRRVVPNVNGLDISILEAGHEGGERPLVLLLHGFPELAYSWRKILPMLADAGYHVVAPDQRGFGATAGFDNSYDGDFASFRVLNIVRDTLGLVLALGHRSVACVVGHDFGSTIAAWCAMARPDIFRSVVLMSAPFAGPPHIGAIDGSRAAAAGDFWERTRVALAALDPPRKHYHAYFASPDANSDMMNGRQGLRAFLRAYFHCKSADWPGNAPRRLGGWSAAELATMPEYYIMDARKNMAETAAGMAPSDEDIRRREWLSEDELSVYVDAFSRTGFQGGLNWYRCRLERALNTELELFSGRTLDAPSMFIAGEKDWGVYQFPGTFERMRDEVCTRMKGAHLIPGAGHWVQQERPEEVGGLLTQFLHALK